MSKSIQFIKSGVVIREYPDSHYSLSWMTGPPMILNKEDRTVVFIPSSQFYDYIEVNEND